MNPIRRAIVRSRAPTQEVKSHPEAFFSSEVAPDTPVFSNWDTSKAVNEGFKASVWVYAAVFKLMQAVGSIPWVAEEKRGDTWEPNEEHPLSLLMQEPNSYMDGNTVMQRLTAHMFLGGNGLLHKVVSSGRLLELWPLNPASGIRPVPHATKFVSHYTYEVEGKPQTLAAEKVVHCMFVDPTGS